MKITDEMREEAQAEYYILSGKAQKDFHQGIADAHDILSQMEQDGTIVHNRWMDGDGWGAGQTLYAVIEEKGGKLSKLKWNPSAGRGLHGAFMVQCMGGGFAAFFPANGSIYSPARFNAN